MICKKQRSGAINCFRRLTIQIGVLLFLVPNLLFSSKLVFCEANEFVTYVINDLIELGKYQGIFDRYDLPGSYDSIREGLEKYAELIILVPYPHPPCGDYLKIVVKIGNGLQTFGVDSPILPRYRKHAKKVIEKCLLKATLKVKRRFTAENGVRGTARFKKPIEFKKKDSKLRVNALNTHIVSFSGMPAPHGGSQMSARHEGDIDVKVKPKFKIEIIVNLKFFHHVMPSSLISSHKLVFPFKPKTYEVSKAEMAPPAIAVVRHDTWKFKLYIDKKHKIECPPEFVPITMPSGASQ